ncbi:hypothetical protein SAMN05660199_00613 [Klenkia soli]|uniref:General stress protein 17M-like domain-containing protein n=1 Tax=Klenkia soli TaxID=1052260 RepID=A0A1H0E0D7_9ACTN|nr:general stress protein [Klenkia soli]SDN75835.1 hypothetical protein SAMN05660199_00613 [Klenkia soli]
MTTIDTTVPAATPTPTGLVTLARFGDYASAQRLVDRLSDERVPVENTRIVGHGLTSVEIVTGRLTVARAALYGAGSGAWFGFFIALLFAIFTIGPAWLGVLLTTVVLGAVFGGLAGAIGHWATRGRRDFSSVSTMQAAEYEVLVEAAVHAQAARIAATA